MCSFSTPTRAFTPARISAVEDPRLIEGKLGGVRSRMRTRLSGDSTPETAAIRCFPLSLVKTGNSNPKDFGFRACYP